MSRNVIAYVYGVLAIAFCMTIPVSETQAEFTPQGPPVVNEKLELDFGEVFEEGVICPGFPVQQDVIGHDIVRIWVSGDETLFVENVNIYITSTNLDTDASVTSKQTSNNKMLLSGGELVEFEANGSPTVVVFPGEGLVSLVAGHLVITFDISGPFPVILETEFRGRVAGQEICDLISP